MRSSPSSGLPTMIWQAGAVMADRPVRAALLDLEGTLFAKGEALPGAAAAVATLRQKGLGIRFLTNIDSQSPVKVAATLAGYGLDVPVADLFTPVSAAREFFAAAPDARVLTLVSTTLREEFAHLNSAAPLGVSVQDCVVVGDDATTDIAGGRDAGARTVQVRTGKYTDQDAEGTTGSADVTVDSVADLPALLAGGFVS